METAQITHRSGLGKERTGRMRLLATVSFVLSSVVLGLAVGACASRGGGREAAPSLDPYSAHEARARITDARSDDPHVRRDAARDLGRIGGDEAAAALIPMLADADAEVAAEAAFALAISGAHNAAGRLVANLPADAPREVLAAAAMGLGNGAGDAFERALIRLAREFDAPPGVPNALFNHYRWRGRPAPMTLPDPILLTYAEHPEAEGRAGFGHLCRAVKDPAVIQPLVRLLTGEDSDDDPFGLSARFNSSVSEQAEYVEVMRAAAMGLARSTSAPWPDDGPARAALQKALSSGRPLVAIAACRALASYEDTAELLVPLLDARDFNVRVAAVQSLARLDADVANDRIAEMAVYDESVFVRGSAITALAELDPDHAYELTSQMMEDPAEFVRASACDALGGAPEAQADSATARLVALAVDDPHVRVRHSALAQLEGREGPLVDAAIARALRDDPDPVVVAVACGVVAADGMDALMPLVRAVPARFPGRDGGDARQGALDALGKLGAEGDHDLLRAYMADENPSVAMAAENALAVLAGVAAPTPRRAGVRGARSGVRRARDGTTGRDMLFFADDGGETNVHMVMETTRGTMTFALDHHAAPLHVAHVAAFAGRGGYDGLSWHRVVPDFVIQGGCPRGDGSGSAGVSLPLEPTRIPFERGTLGMPRSGHPDSGGCQLFVMHSRAPHLDVHYTAFGRLIDGNEVIDQIDVDDRILSVRIVIPIERFPPR